jgi:RNA polymerase sigma factor (sigma-70 family)
MATGQLSTVLRHIHKLVDAHRTEELTDAQLLERFVSRHEEAAFAALVQRYGPMVLGVCRRVLHHEHDAEDAFQATFLILVRKAARIGKREALGCWLHQVAYRLALKAKASAARRRLRERRVTSMQQTDFIATVAWNDLRPVLDEEVDRLPEKFRTPFVLCYLEGKTYEQAAQQLGCLPGTVSRRLAQARALLRVRLTRRGLALPAGVLAVALSQHAAAASVSAPLAASTIKAALSSTAGTAATAAGVSTQVAALVKGGLRAMFATKLKIVTALVLAVSAVTLGVGVLTHRALAQRQDEKKAPTEAASRAETTRSVQAGLAPPSAGASKETMTVSGQVLNPDGKPAADVPVAVIGRPRNSVRVDARVARWPEVLSQGKTDDAGRFRLLTPRTSKEHFWEVYLLAAGVGRALTRVDLDADAEQPNAKVQLGEEQILHGRLVDLQGQGAKGVKIQVPGVYGTTPEGRYYYTYLQKPPQNWPTWPQPATTDDEGRFRLRGLNARWEVAIQVHDERFATQELGIKPEDWKGGKEVVRPLAPARILEGVVTYEDTGKPAANLRLLVQAQRERYDFNRSLDPLECRTDERGRYHIVPHVGNFFTVVAQPPEGSPYLLVYKELDWRPANVVKQEVNLALPRGIVVRGVITEKPSGKPVAGSSVEFEPFMDNNPYYRRDVRPMDRSWGRRVVSDAEGKFQITVLPGPGHLLILGPTLNYVHAEISVKQLYGQGLRPNRRYYPDALVRLDLKPESGTHETAITLRRGVTLAGRVVGPDDKPVARGFFVCRSYIPKGYDLNRVDSREMKDGRFELPGCDPGKTAEVFFLDAKNRCGAVVQLSGKQAGETVTVRLQPCGSATARLLDEDGKPLVNLRTWLEILVTPGLHVADEFRMEESKEFTSEYAYQSTFDPGRKETYTDAQGRVRFDALIPGATHLTICQPREGGTINLHKDFKVEPGQTLDLGDITVRPPKRTE